MDILESLKVFGFAVQPGAVEPSECERLGRELDDIERQKREQGLVYDVNMQVVIYNLHLERPDVFLPMLGAAPVFPLVQQILSNGQQIVLNSLSGSRSVRVNDGADLGDAWRAHIDTRMPAPDFGHTESVIASICIDDFTIESGATRIWPYTHLSGMRPPPSMGTDDLPGAVHVIAPRGSIIYWLGQSWHAISKNHTGVRRWGIIQHYTYWWIKPTFDFTQCGAEIYSLLTPQQKGLLGFNSRPPVSPDIRIFTVTKADELPQDYATAMRQDYARGQQPATAHKTSDVKG